MFLTLLNEPLQSLSDERSFAIPGYYCGCSSMETFVDFATSVAFLRSALLLHSALFEGLLVLITNLLRLPLTEIQVTHGPKCKKKKKSIIKLEQNIRSMVIILCKI